MPAPTNLTPGARQTLNQLEHHPTTHNLGWHDLVVLLKEIAVVEESHAGAKIVVHLGDQRLDVTRPEGQTVSEHTVLELRRLFKDADFF